MGGKQEGHSGEPVMRRQLYVNFGSLSSHSHKTLFLAKLQLDPSSATGCIRPKKSKMKALRK